MQPTTVVLPSPMPANLSSFPHSTSFSGPFSPLGASNLSSAPQAMVQIPRRNSVMSANDEIPPSRSMQFGGEPIGKNYCSKLVFENIRFVYPVL